MHNELINTLEDFLPQRDDRPSAVDFNYPKRHYNLATAISTRIGATGSRTVVPANTVLELAAERYFSLIGRAQSTLRGRFSESEFDVILNVECASIWEWDADLTVATMVADDNGVEALDDLESQSELRELLRKLIELSPLENAALVDACEQVWRGYQNPLLEV